MNSEQLAVIREVVFELRLAISNESNISRKFDIASSIIDLTKVFNCDDLVDDAFMGYYNQLDETITAHYENEFLKPQTD